MRRRERTWESGGVDVGVDSFAAVVTDPDTGAVVESAERMAHQLPEADKAVRSDVVYENTGSLEELDRWVAALVARLT